MTKICGFERETQERLQHNHGVPIVGLSRNVSHADLGALADKALNVLIRQEPDLDDFGFWFP